LNDDELLEDQDDDESLTDSDEDEGEDAGDDHGVDPFASLYASYQAELAARTRKYGEYISTAGYESDLRRAYESLDDVPAFKPGDFVQWKTFMRESRLPEYGAPAVVVAVDGAFRDSKRAQQAFPQHDILLAVLDGDQDFVTFSASSARFTRWQGDSWPSTDQQ